MFSLPWITAIAFSAIAHISAEELGKTRLCYVFKPLTTVLITAFFCWHVENWSVVSYLVLAALLLSLCGDIFLMLPSDKFLPGLTSFLLAHLVYVGVFSLLITDFSITVFPFLAFLYATILLFKLWPSLGEMRIAVMLYSSVIMLMLMAAIQLWVGASNLSSLLVLVGAMSFAFSDSIIAIKRFIGAKAWHEPVLLATYYVAQLLIAVGMLLQVNLP
ncbi:lysoplasmalogenase [Alteromonas sediminis]|uniref:Lysoplasmalogenase n=1 Tax=Alteromonas sediminis TaxID=2259342 RepID=A0A3N5Y6E0_9ALTE|nr:lysoplasmalogenase [Alteromonas sediminis]RPJ66009.1 lysoplasmalogenase [Alteromonas sediminis]